MRLSKLKILYQSKDSVVFSISSVIEKRSNCCRLTTPRAERTFALDWLGVSPQRVSAINTIKNSTQIN